MEIHIYSTYHRHYPNEANKKSRSEEIKKRRMKKRKKEWGWVLSVNFLQLVYLWHSQWIFNYLAHTRTQTETRKGARRCDSCARTRQRTCTHFFNFKALGLCQTSWICDKTQLLPLVRIFSARLDSVLVVLVQNRHSGFGGVNKSTRRMTRAILSLLSSSFSSCGHSSESSSTVGL